MAERNAEQNNHSIPTFAQKEVEIRNIVHKLESAYDRFDLDAVSSAELDARDAGMPWYKIKQIVRQRARVPALLRRDIVPAYVVELARRGRFPQVDRRR